MAVEAVILAAASEEYSPPEQEIEVSVVGPLVFITVYRNTQNGREREYEVPSLRIIDLEVAIKAGVIGQP